MKISSILGTANSLLQFIVLLWHFTSNVYPHVESVSYSLHTAPLFMLVVSLTIQFQNMLLLLYSFVEQQLLEVEARRNRTQQHYLNLFYFTLSCVLVNLIGWLMVVSYTATALHNSGTILFIISIILLYFVLVYHKRTYWLIFGVMYSIAAVCILTFGISYVLGNNVISFWVEWVAFFVFSGTNILFFYIVLEDVF